MKVGWKFIRKYEYYSSQVAIAEFAMISGLDECMTIF
jgi:hypothetical protein